MVILIHRSMMTTVCVEKFDFSTYVSCIALPCVSICRWPNNWSVVALNVLKLHTNIPAKHLWWCDWCHSINVNKFHKFRQFYEPHTDQADWLTLFSEVEYVRVQVPRQLYSTWNPLPNCLRMKIKPKYWKYWKGILAQWSILPKQSVRACLAITSGRRACSINVITFDAEHRRFTEHSVLIASFTKY